MANRARSMTVCQNDERPIVNAYVTEEETGGAVDLTNADSVDFFMYPVNEDGTLGTVKVDGAAGVIADAVTGNITYTWATGSPSADTDTLGRFFAYFVIFWGASDTVPETTSGFEVNIVSPKDRWS